MQVERLRQRVHRGRRRGAALGYGAVAVLMLGLVCLGGHYVATELSYAEVEDIQLRRDPIDPERVALYYRPLRSGTIGFGRADGDRRTELLDQVVPDEVGKRQSFHWRVRGLESGEVIEVTHRSGWRRVTDSLTVPEWPSPAGPAAADLSLRLGDGVLDGQVVNATDNQPVSNAQVRIAGTPLSTHTDAEGHFRIPGAPTGLLPIEISADGFTTDRFQREVTAAAETFVRVALSPGMEKGQIRIVLTWGNVPKDLDAHLEGPLPDGQRFHVDYRHQGDLRSREFVCLDVDDRNGEGPETITVLGVLPGVYRYYVYDFSNRHDPQSTALARSGAEVKVYQGGQTFRFRAGHEMQGNLWDVCTIEVAPDGAVVKRVDAYQGIKAEALGLYEKRTLADRQRWIVNDGGNLVSERAVNEGLDWLARHQAPDGSWSCECLGSGSRSQCEEAAPCTGEGDTYEMAHTGLALLAFQAGGHYYFNNTPYSEVVRRGLDWMVAHQRPDGGLIGSKPKGRRANYHKHYMYEHGIAAFALADARAAATALGAAENDSYRRATEKAVEFIHANQHTDGGWRYTDDLKRPGDTSVTGWQVLALKSAQEAGIPVHDQCIRKIRKFFEYREMGENGRTGYDDRIPQTDATTGVGMLAKQFLLGEPDAPLVSEAARYLADLAEMKWADRKATQEYADYYLWYNCTLAMFQVGGDLWRRWNDVVRDTIVNLQRHDGCARGSWDPNTKWGRYGGRIYTTALAVLTLEVYYRYTRQQEIDDGVFELPATSRSEAPGEAVAPETTELPARGPEPGRGSLDRDTAPSELEPRPPRAGPGEADPDGGERNAPDR